MAAKRVKVWNDNNVDLKEEFKGQVIEIPAGGFVEMGRSQAIQFKGQYRPIKVDGMKQQVPNSKKIIRIEAVKGKEESETFVCQMDGREFKTQKALENYMKKNFPNVETVTK